MEDAKAKTINLLLYEGDLEGVAFMDEMPHAIMGYSDTITRRLVE